MKSRSSLSLLALVLLCCSAISATPYPDSTQVVLNQSPPETGDGVKHSVLDHVENKKKEILKGKANTQKWIYAGKEYVRQDDLLYELVSHPALTAYQLKVVEPELCDPSVKQYSGYLDIANDKHLLFW
ncbi:hypothetical protein P691DRAFT_768238 [Macrolepiota fuliginosa MF-IS2]|nr:hypothetical protein P691DRAFT_768238 [Macrolepiota fuliginosa MF-IS2]